MLVFGKNLREHRGWIVFVVLATAGPAGWYVWESRVSSHWLSGSSLPGFSLGVAAALIIVFECLLWVRKKLRAWRIGRVQVWMRAHIWLGLLCAPLAILHSGFRLGGTLSTVLMVLLVVVVISGLWGLWMQHTLPRKLYEQVPAETIYSQIPYLSAQLIDEADQLVNAVCPAAGEATDETEAKALAVGAVRTVGKVQGKVVQTRVDRQPVPGSEPMRSFYLETVRPFLRGESDDSPLSAPTHAVAVFHELKAQVPPEAHSAVDVLADFCGQRRQWQEQARLYRWLQNWLWVHLPLSVALLVVLVAHIYGALKYW